MNSPKYNKSILNLYNNDEKVLSKGFVPLANTILIYKNELEITYKEIGLIENVLSFVFQNKPIIKDKDLSLDSKKETKRKTFVRQRNSLKAKGYLETKVIVDYDKGFRTRGIKYDFSGLWIKIKELVERDEVLNGNVEKSKEKNNGNTTINENNFLQEYNKIHKEIVGTLVNFEKQTSYKEHTLKHYSNRHRELSEININDIKQAHKHRLLENENVNKSLAFQDIVGGLLFEISENNQFENKTTTKNRRTPKVKTADEFLNKDNIDTSKPINNDDDLDF